MPSPQTICRQTITRFTLGTGKEYNSLEVFQYEITRAALLWPAIKTIRMARFPYPKGVDLAEYFFEAIRILSEAEWTDIECFNCSNYYGIYEPKFGIALSASSHRSRNLRSLRLSCANITNEFIQYLASGDYSALEVLQLGGNRLSRLTAGTGVELANLLKNVRI